MTKQLDGKAAAARVLERVKTLAAELKNSGAEPGLATVLVGENPASHVYVNMKIKTCEKNGLRSIHVPLPTGVSEESLIDAVKTLNARPDVHGIIVQLPLPGHINTEKILEAIDPQKDADGLHPLNQGRWGQIKQWKDIQNAGIPLPCTPWGVMELLELNGVDFVGKQAVVVGRSTLVGKPLAQMLLSANATVTVAHSRTVNMTALCRSADILVAAIGLAGFIKADMVKPGSVVVDVGINRTDQGLRGDVDFDAVSQVAGAITPVPGGVGPMTVAMLLLNTVMAARRQK